MAIRRGYELTAAQTTDPLLRRAGNVATGWVVGAAATLVLGAATRAWWAVGVAVGASVVVAAFVSVGRVSVVVVMALLGAVGVARADAAWHDLRPDQLGPFSGWATVVDDPRPAGAATNVVVELEGERFELWVRGRAGQLRARSWQGGDRVVVVGRRVALDDERQRRVASRHVVGELDFEWLGDRRAGSALARSSNRVRDLVARGAATLGDERGTLTRGLVIGDDRDQPPETLERFRESGLSHLTAVSGQNVAYLLAAAGPLLRRRRPLARWIVTLGLIAWFVVVTRAEPSILRAGSMAALSATAFLLGRPRQPLRLLALAVIGLVLVDPLLVWSVGFWLSVGATAGVTAIGPWLATRLVALGPLALPVGITIGAQLGVAIPSVLVFGRLSVIGTVANLVAVPVAGLVMLYGLPACLVAGAVPPLAPVVMAPVEVGVGWVDAVATVGAAVEPGPPWSWLGWIVLTAVMVVLLRRARHSVGDLLEDEVPTDADQ